MGAKFATSRDVSQRFLPPWSWGGRGLRVTHPSRRRPVWYSWLRWFLPVLLLYHFQFTSTRTKSGPGLNCTIRLIQQSFSTKRLQQEVQLRNWGGLNSTKCQLFTPRAQLPVTGKLRTREFLEIQFDKMLAWKMDSAKCPHQPQQSRLSEVPPLKTGHCSEIFLSFAGAVECVARGHLCDEWKELKLPRNPTRSLDFFLHIFWLAFRLHSQILTSKIPRT